VWRLTHNPTAGFILNAGQGAQDPGPLSREERELLRDLALAVREAAAHPKQQKKRELWYQHNALEKTRPLVLVFLEDSWEEVLPAEGNVEVRDPFWRQWEWYLRHLLYRDTNLDDDFVIEPDLWVKLDPIVGGWGLEPTAVARSDNPRGSYSWTPALQDPAGLAKLKPATLDIDLDAATVRVEAVREVFGDLLPVHLHCAPSGVCLFDIAAHLRGITQVMLDMIDRPEWLHDLMRFLSSEELRKRRFLEEAGVLTLNNRNHYVDAGGIGYTRELPVEGGDGRPVKLSDLWCHAAAQSASETGPEHHEEFIVEHELPVLELAGLNAYGCCEPYTHKFDMLKRRVPRLRRVSVSPWCDVERAAEALEDKYIFSWKPNPSMLVGRFDEQRIRKYIRRTLDAAADCRLEIILKDAITLDNEPRRVAEWLRIVREEIGRDADTAAAG